MSAPLLAQALGGDVFFAFISAIAFATILAVVAGLTISASTSFAHDFYSNVIHHGRARRPGGSPRRPHHGLRRRRHLDCDRHRPRPLVNVAFLVGLAFAVAASANLPVIVFSIFWRRFNTDGAVCGLAVGLLASLVLILVSPSIMGVDAPTRRRDGASSDPGQAAVPAGESRASSASRWDSSAPFSEPS